MQHGLLLFSAYLLFTTLACSLDAPAPSCNGQDRGDYTLSPASLLFVPNHQAGDTLVFRNQTGGEKYFLAQGPQEELVRKTLPASCITNPKVDVTDFYFTQQILREFVSADGYRITYENRIENLAERDSLLRYEVLWISISQLSNPNTVCAIPILTQYAPTYQNRTTIQDLLGQTTFSAQREWNGQSFTHVYSANNCSAPGLENLAASKSKGLVYFSDLAGVAWVKQ